MSKIQYPGQHQLIVVATLWFSLLSYFYIPCVHHVADAFTIHDRGRRRQYHTIQKIAILYARADNYEIIYDEKTTITEFDKYEDFPQQEQDEELDEELQLSRTFIRFSRAFQRHVVYNCTNHKQQIKQQGKPQQIDLSAYHDCQCDQTLESFLFVDEAISKYPNATLIKLVDIGVENDNDDYDTILAGMGTLPSHRMLSKPNAECATEEFRLKVLSYLASIALSGQQTPLPPPGSSQLKETRDAVMHQLGNEVPHRRLYCHTPESIHRNYDRLVDILTRARVRRVVRKEMVGVSHASDDEGRGTSVDDVDSLLMQLTKTGLCFTEGGARAVIAEFPQVCLYDVREVEDRIRFMTLPVHEQIRKDHTQPRASVKKNVDYYTMMRKGYGAGLTIEQATQAIRAVPQLLSMYHEDSKKPSMLYFYNELGVSHQLLELTRLELGSRLSGCDSSDVYAFAYLNSIGVDWVNIRILIDAIPLVTFCDKEPGWEVLEKSSPVRSELHVGMLNFLRKRLQIDTSDLHAMIKVHSRITSYKVASNLLPTLNAIQDRLFLSSRDLQRIVLRMPSITGMSVESTNDKISALDARIDFFTKEANLSYDDLKQALLKQPSLLQYSIDSTLRPKLHYLLQELHIDKLSIRRIIRISPAIFGLSLKQNIMPKIAAMREECNLSNEDIGIIVVTVPSILSLSLKKKIEPCFQFLRRNLQLTNPSELGSIILASPRILMHGVDTSLAPKLQMILNALECEGSSDKMSMSEMISIVKGNPSILATSIAILQARIDKYIGNDMPLKEGFKPKSVGRKKISPRQELPMHQLVDEGSPLQKKTLDSETNLGKVLSLQDVRKLPFSLYDSPNDPISIVAFAAGRIFPHDDINTVRGRRRSGGIAIQIPQITEDGEGFNARFQDATRLSFGMIMPRKENSKLIPQYGLVQAGFPFLRPSRARCDLYACHGALKVVLQLLKQAAEETDLRHIDVNIIIYTHSTYAWNLLKDSESLLDWGSASIMEDVNFDIPGPLSLANTDLLFPLTKTMHRMTNNAVINRSRNKRLCIGKNVNISFQYIGDLFYDEEIAKATRVLENAAKEAAIWQYERL